MIDIFVTIKDRYELSNKSLLSLYDSISDRSLYRLTVLFDGIYPTEEGFDEIYNTLDKIDVDYVLTSFVNEGLGPTINRALSHIESINQWYSDPKAGDSSKVSDLIVYCQDDLLYTKDWLITLRDRFYQLEKPLKLGFATGLECVEHKTKSQIPNPKTNKPDLLKDWIRAAQMMARREYWMSMYPITRFDPETQRVRAKPNNGIGSGVDWHFIRNHENSVCKTGKTCLVMPGLVTHLGYNKSTWLKRNLPESESDLKVIENENCKNL